MQSLHLPEKIIYKIYFLTNFSQLQKNSQDLIHLIEQYHHSSFVFQFHLKAI